ncbi:hypothetical protein [Natrinema altunense]|uniref:hypothetical protein n=1 Tax=Natrinema altunense TaxID=222984 RepID=UPI0037429BF6
MESTSTTSDSARYSGPAAAATEVAMTGHDEWVDPASTRTEPADEAADATDWSLPDCPACGRPVWVVTVNGPSDATASPCGCSVPPGSLERE